MNPTRVIIIKLIQLYFSLQTPAKVLNSSQSDSNGAKGDGWTDKTVDSSTDDKSVSRASQLLTSDSSLTFSRDSTIREKGFIN